MTGGESRGGERSPLRIRDARPDEAAALTELAMRSKAWWGYTADFMARCRPVLTVSPALIGQVPVRVAQADDEIAGFHALRPLGDDRMELDLLFVDPPWIGRGVGALLLDDALQLARLLGCGTLVIESDPFAEPFYARHGARRVGWMDSTAEEGRRLPLLEIATRGVAGLSS